MVALMAFVSSLLLVSLALASPLSPLVHVKTAMGTAQGTVDTAGARRFIVKYAHAERWNPSIVASTWDLPYGSDGPESVPLACPQRFIDSSMYTEDCLSMILFVPSTLKPSDGVPTLMWIHGGSFITGSASGPGLDGAKLAVATGSVVAVVQYRLGALGYLAPDGTTNLAVKDLVNAMQFLQVIVPSFGGSASKITLAGQSSGASMIRTLLAVPSASSLFRSAILQSDPMNYGLLAPKTQSLLQNYFNNQTSCSDKSCWSSLSLDVILGAEEAVFNSGASIDPSAGSGEPIRPVQDEPFILESAADLPRGKKPILLSSVLQEAGLPIYGAFPEPLPASSLAPACEQTFGEGRTKTILASPYYDNDPADARTQLQLIGTDSLWKCPSWTFARNWVQNGGRAYVGVYTVGASYPGNEAAPFCTQAGIVCHQDDIQIVFGTVAKPTAAQAALIKEMQIRYKAFLSSGDPNARGVRNWPEATSSNVHAIQLGGSGAATVGACDPSFWGKRVLYDYQFYNT